MLAVAPGLVACGSTPLPSPTPRASTADAAGSPVPSRPAPPERTRDPISLGPSGSVIAVEATTRDDLGVDVTIRVAEPDGSDGIERHASVVLPKGWRLADNLQPRVNADGWLALEVTDDEEASTKTVVVDLEAGGARVSPPLDGIGALWLPDGSLVTTEQVVDGDRIADLVRRYPDHGAGPPAEVRVESPLRLDSELAIAADLSGVHVVRSTADDRVEPLTLRWDGQLTDRDERDAPYAGLGVGRTSSSEGATITTWCADVPLDAGRCGLTWVRADGSSAKVGLPAGIPPTSAGWTPDGTRLVVTGAGSALVAREALPVPTVTVLGRLRSLPEEATIIGMTDTAAVLQADDGVYLLALDGSGTRGPMAGRAAGALP